MADCNLTRSYWLKLRAESKRERERERERVKFYLDRGQRNAQLLDPNWPIYYASQRAVRYYQPGKNSYLEGLTVVFDTSGIQQLGTPSSDRANADLFNLSSIVVLLVERFARQKPSGRILRDFVPFLFLGFFLFFLSISMQVACKVETRFSPTRGRRFEIPSRFSAGSFICQRDSDC